MNFRQILEYMPLIPQDSRHFQMLIVPTDDEYGSRKDEVELFSACYKDLAFRWHFVRSFTEIGEPLPKEVNDPYILRTYKYLTGGHKDRFITMAIALSKNLPTVMQTGIKAMLLDANATYLKISEMVGVEPMAIKLFEKLFFNIRDRLTEHAFIAAIPYPEGRVDGLLDAEKYMRNPIQEIIKIGYTNGLEHAAYAMGLKVEMITEDFSTFSKKLENMFMSNAYWLAKNGFMDTYHPGIQHAKQIIAATKQGDSDESTEEDYGASLLGIAMHEEITNSMKILTQERKALLIETQQQS